MSVLPLFVPCLLHKKNKLKTGSEDLNDSATADLCPFKQQIILIIYFHQSGELEYRDALTLNLIHGWYYIREKITKIKHGAKKPTMRAII
jgi:hypothetical protein